MGRHQLRGKPKPSERDRRTMKRILSNNHRTTAAGVTGELIIHREDSVSTTTVGRKLHKSNIQGTATTAKRLVTENNAKRSKRRSDNHKTWTADDLKNVIWSDESSFTFFPTSCRVYVWRTPKDAYKPEFLVPSVKHGGRSATVWVAIFWCTAGSIITMNGRITASAYVGILGNLGHPMVHMLFPNNDAIFQDDNWIIHTDRKVQSWFQEHGDALKHIPCPRLNVIGTLWSVLESTVICRFPSPSSLKQPDHVFL